MRQPYCDRSSLVDGISRSRERSLNSCERSQRPLQATRITRRKTWAGATQPVLASCPHPPKQPSRRSTDGHALLCAAAERCLVLRSVPEEKVDLDRNHLTGPVYAKHPKQKGAHRQPSR